MKRFLATLPFLGIFILVYLHWPRNNARKPASPPNSPAPLAAELAVAEQIRSSPVARPPAEERASAERVEKLAGQIKADLFCDEKGQFLREDSAQNPRRALELLAALEAASASAPDPCLQAALSKGKKVALHFSQKAETRECQFVRALVLSDTLEGIKDRQAPTPEELALSTQLLEKLSQREPRNGFYPFLLLGVLDQAHASRTEVEGNFLKFLRAPNFENPLIALSVKLRELAHRNPTAYALSLEAYYYLLAPDYSRAQAIARELVIEKSFRADLFAWAKLVAHREEKIFRSALTEPMVWLIDEAVLRSLALRAWENHWPQTRVPYTIEITGWKRVYDRVAGLQQLDQDALYPHINHCLDYAKKFRTLFPKTVDREKKMIEKWRKVGPF